MEVNLTAKTHTTWIATIEVSAAEYGHLTSVELMDMLNDENSFIHNEANIRWEKNETAPIFVVDGVSIHKSPGDGLPINEHTTPTTQKDLSRWFREKGIT